MTDTLTSLKMRWDASVSQADTSPRLDNETRNAIKTAVSKHPEWNKFRHLVLDGRNTGQLTKAELLRTAWVLNIALNSETVEASAAVAPEPETEPETNNTPEPVAAPASVYSAASAVQASVNTLRPFLSDKLVTDLDGKVQALVSAAQDAADNAAPAAVAPSGELPFAKPVSQEKASSLFGLRDKVFTDMSLRVWDAQDAPRPDSDFVFQADLLQDALVSIERNRTIWLAGPAGTGKTTLPREIAARLRRPCVRIAHDRTTEPVELIGGRFPSTDGGTEWRDGVLTAAIRRPGTIIILDEPTFCRAGVLSTYQTLLDHRFLVLKENGGERVDVARGVTFVIADNTGGNGDASGRYADTQMMNAAFIDRASKILRVDYLPAKLEVQALMSRSKCKDAFAETVVDFANLTRKAAANGEATAGLSFRRLVEFAIDVDAGIPAQRAFENCVLNQLPEDDFVCVNELAKVHLDFAALENAASGKAPVNVSKAGQAFDNQADNL